MDDSKGSFINKKLGCFQKKKKKKPLVQKAGMVNPRKPVIIDNWSKLKTKLSKQHLKSISMLKTS